MNPEIAEHSSNPSDGVGGWAQNGTARRLIHQVVVVQKQRRTKGNFLVWSSAVSALAVHRRESVSRDSQDGVNGEIVKSLCLP
jgi:hypothetical protein